MPSINCSSSPVRFAGGTVKRLIAFPTEDGHVIVVEVAEETPPGTVRAARPGEVIERAEETFEAALGAIRWAAEALVTQLRDLSERPDEVNVEFAVKLTAQVGAIITSTGGEANFKVSLTWTQGPT
jgi:hypothetical protein